MTRPSDKPRNERLAKLTAMYGAKIAEDIVSGAEPPGPPKAEQAFSSENLSGGADAPPERALVILETRIGNVFREAERHTRQAFEAYRTTR